MTKAERTLSSIYAHIANEEARVRSLKALTLNGALTSESLLDLDRLTDLLAEAKQLVNEVAELNA